MCVLDGNAYDNKVVEAGEEREEDLEACALLLNNKAQALLMTGPGGYPSFGRPALSAAAVAVLLQQLPGWLAAAGGGAAASPSCCPSDRVALCYSEPQLVPQPLHSVDAGITHIANCKLSPSPPPPCPSWHPQCQLQGDLQDPQPPHALPYPAAGGTHNANSKVTMPLRKGVAVLPDLHVSGGW